MRDAIAFDHVSKRYQIGTQHHSLRDAIPMLFTGGRPELAKSGEDGTFWALRDVSFRVAQGETLGIIGHNGAGKSTTLKLLSHITKPTSGTIRSHGKLAALIEVGAGFHPDLTGRENVFLNGTILGMKRVEVRRLFDQIVAFAEVEKFIDTPVKRYSSGMYIRLGFAIAAHVDPDVLLIDEVLAVGDLAFQQKCLQRIQELKQQGKTMAFISHNLNAVQRLCDRVLLLVNGRIAAEGPAAQVINDYRTRVITSERKRFTETLAKQRREQPDAGAVQIEEVRLRDAAGAVTETFETGEPMTIEVAYACARRIERPTLRITIERLDGFTCHIASTQRDGLVVPPLEGRGVLTLTYPAMTLLPNAFHVSVEISEVGRAAPLDSRKHGCFFTVISERYDGGLVHLEHEWQWQAANGDVA
jgi:ABC-type polysaccharide/polyol phosphate transport system ATPase subunit